MISFLMDVTPGFVVFTAIAGVALGTIFGYLILSRINIKILRKSQEKATKIIANAENEAKTVKKEAILEAKDECLKIRNQTDDEVKVRRSEIHQLENNLLAREDKLLKREEILESKQTNLDNYKLNLENKEKELDEKNKELLQIKKDQIAELEKIACLTKEEAQNELKEKFLEETRIRAVKEAKQIEQDVMVDVDKKAKEILTSAIQQCAVDITQEVTSSTVAIPNEEVKGRLIGREGRNIRAFEQETGVDLIIDDTPDVITLSNFDPMRREIARIALEKLILDGRIHPGKIEELVKKAKKDVENTIREQGENACFDLEIHNMHPELMKILGRLMYRTSYGQNCLAHSIEVAKISAKLALSLGADEKIALRGGLLHDVGKALDRDIEGTHVQIGVDLAKKYKENPAVIHCIEAHHGDVPTQSIEALIVQIADAVSSARPGARRESIENYIKRIESIESIASKYKGVEKVFAIQAGREIRVIVKPEEVSEESTYILAKDIAKNLETDLDYPGQIKVNIIRETRTVEYAK